MLSVRNSVIDLCVSMPRVRICHRQIVCFDMAAGCIVALWFLELRKSLDLVRLRVQGFASVRMVVMGFMALSQAVFSSAFGRQAVAKWGDHVPVG